MPNLMLRRDMKMFELLGLKPQKPFIKMQPETVEADSKFNQRKKPKWSRLDLQIERNEIKLKLLQKKKLY